ncbi:MAG: hypothetical protein MUE59_04930 [Thiobacillaceae bacterium]|nr:hypothetical protein [Thiobacillaceae bacterium]
MVASAFTAGAAGAALDDALPWHFAQLPFVAKDLVPLWQEKQNLPSVWSSKEILALPFSLLKMPVWQSLHTRPLSAWALPEKMTGFGPPSKTSSSSSGTASAWAAKTIAHNAAKKSRKAEAACLDFHLVFTIRMLQILSLRGVVRRSGSPVPGQHA